MCRCIFTVCLSKLTPWPGCYSFNDFCPYFCAICIHYYQLVILKFTLGILGDNSFFLLLISLKNWVKSVKSIFLFCIGFSSLTLFVFWLLLQLWYFLRYQGQFSYFITSFVLKSIKVSFILLFFSVIFSVFLIRGLPFMLGLSPEQHTIPKYMDVVRII